ncbi:DNA-3-methyladenine glycosylase I [Halovulum dunhuangense]|uniref:DNA-3-methyladenine glycosylase I n=1 Tax=Halovulum dunhuangense TaxID=1505036 RepID=A0A849KVF5_9RHOB|nr:DNA-3-methyladenine glycosylase I [Halovulum dunhuangense]NNU79641.1 DNA-3-methyladenine glycosylase I [Halovulum dunhuangense]
MQAPCPWCGTDPLYVRYHDEEWGVPELESRALWEKLMLDGFQAGLSWITILRKRDAFRAAFDGFDPVRVARYGPEDEARLLSDSGIVRHKGKIRATIRAAQLYCEIEAREGFATRLWDYVDGQPQVNRWRTMSEVPAKTDLSERISKDLRAQGFAFCGPTIVYAFMQAVGMVNDHLVTCPRHAALA